MYCGTTFGFKPCVHTVHIQVCTSGNNKLQGPESKPDNQLGKFSLAEICCKLQCSNTAGFAMTYCIGRVNTKHKMEFNFDRLHRPQTIGWCLLLCCMSCITSMSKRKQHFSLTGNFIVPRQYCIFLTEFPAR